MTVDFSLVLALGALVTGVIWLLDIVFFARNRTEENELLEDSGRERDGASNELSEPFLVE